MFPPGVPTSLSHLLHRPLGGCLLALSLCLPGTPCPQCSPSLGDHQGGASRGIPLGWALLSQSPPGSKLLPPHTLKEGLVGFALWNFEAEVKTPCLLGESGVTQSICVICKIRSGQGRWGVIGCSFGRRGPQSQVSQLSPGVLSSSIGRRRKAPGETMAEVGLRLQRVRRAQHAPRRAPPPQPCADSTTHTLPRMCMLVCSHAKPSSGEKEAAGTGTAGTFFHSDKNNSRVF